MKKEKLESILFVCLGNICRSPLAEGLMRSIQTQYQLNFHLDSAGTSGYHRGEAPDSRTRANALKNGIDLSQLKSRQFVHEDLSRFDRIFVMDRNNLRDIHMNFKESNQLHKLSLLPHPEKKGESIEIPDPYYGTENDFENVFQLLSKSIETLCQEFSKPD